MLLDFIPPLPVARRNSYRTLVLCLKYPGGDHKHAVGMFKAFLNWCTKIRTFYQRQSYHVHRHLRCDLEDFLPSS